VVAGDVRLDELDELRALLLAVLARQVVENQQAGNYSLQVAEHALDLRVEHEDVGALELDLVADHEAERVEVVVVVLARLLQLQHDLGEVELDLQVVHAAHDRGHQQQRVRELEDLRRLRVVQQHDQHRHHLLPRGHHQVLPVLHDQLLSLLPNLQQHQRPLLLRQALAVQQAQQEAERLVVLDQQRRPPLRDQPLHQLEQPIRVLLTEHLPHYLVPAQLRKLQFVPLVVLQNARDRRQNVELHLTQNFYQLPKTNIITLLVALCLQGRNQRVNAPLLPNLLLEILRLHLLELLRFQHLQKVHLKKHLIRWNLVYFDFLLRLQLFLRSVDKTLLYVLKRIKPKIKCDLLDFKRKGPFFFRKTIVYAFQPVLINCPNNLGRVVFEKICVLFNLNQA